MRKIVKISFTIALVLAVIVLPAFTDMDHNGKTYREFVVEVLNPTDHSMITLEEIRELATGKFGTIEGMAQGLVDLKELEEYIRRNPYVSSCEVFKTLDNVLVLKAFVREPLVRIINDDLQQYLLDRKGFMMPLKEGHPSHILIANGRISDRYLALDKTEKPIWQLADTSQLRQIYPLAVAISRDEFLASFIEQIYVNDSLDIELVPRIGHHQIIAGDGENAAEKMENLKAFYQKVMNRMDWNTYRMINIKYKNQVVCSK
jgi:cell division protein FtsQ